MKVFNETCPTPVEDMALDRIREIRMRENASRAVFADYLNVTKGLVSQWERGAIRRRSASLKLVTLVAKNCLGAPRISTAVLARRHRATETVTGDGSGRRTWAGERDCPLSHFALRHLRSFAHP